MMQGRNQTTFGSQVDEWADSIVEPAQGITLSAIQRSLRGRYHLVVVLGLICTLIGATVGLTAGGPKYTSTALIHVAPVLPRVLFANEQNKPLYNFESFIEGQATLLLSRGTLVEALKDSAMRSTGWPVGSRGEERLLAETTVNRNRSEEFITVSVTDRNPARAQAATNAIIDAYIRPQRKQANLKRQATERTLIEREHMLELDVNELQERIVEVSSRFGGTDLLERLYSAKVRQLEYIESKLSSSTPVYISDRVLAMLELEETNLLLDVDAIDPSFGPNHSEAKLVSTRLHTVRRLIADRKDMLAERSGWNTQLATMNQDADATRDARAGLAINNHGIKQQPLIEEVTLLGRAKHLITTLQKQLDTKTTQLAETSFRLEEFNVESIQVGGTRISIAARGHLPSVPSKDRRVVGATFGAFFGAVCGVSIICLIGFLDRRCRFIADIEILDSEILLLGSIPDQEIDHQDHQARGSVAIHEIRNALEITRGSENSRTYCVTSPDVGDGKTSLALALGASFALAGHQTLVIDADLQHSGMTRSLDLKDSIGLGEALKGQIHPDCIHSTTTSGLSVMPVGNAENFGPEKLSGESFDLLLKQARLTYDTVIVDTTPLLGGLEASLVAVLCDRVILAVSRNQDARLATAALGRLEQLGAQCVGIVFNRSLPSDHIQTLNGNSESSSQSPIMVIGETVAVQTLSRPSKNMERAA